MKRKNVESAQNSNNTSLNLIYCIVSFGLFPLLVASLVIFSIWRFIVKCILSLRYKNKFGGLLNGPDSVWALDDDTSNLIVNCLFLIDVKSNNPHFLMEKIRKTVNKSIFLEENYAKVWSIRQRAFGYNFLIRNEVTSEDCLSFLPTDHIKDEVTRNDLQNLMSEFSNKPLPKNNCALWEILVSDKPIKWNNSMKYPVISRWSHVFGDGFAMVRMLTNGLGEETSNSVPKRFISKVTNNSIDDVKFLSLNHLENILKSILTNLYIIILGPAIMLHQTRFMANDKSILHGPKLSGEKIAVWKCEKSEKLIPMVKAIKNKHNSRFFDVMLTALSESLNKYYIAKNEEAPEFATTVITQLLIPLDLESKPVLENNFALGFLQLPISEDVNSISSRLNKVTNQSKILQDSLTFQISYWSFTIVAKFLPDPLLRLLYYNNSSTMVITNVPCVQKLSIFEGCGEAEDIIFWIPNKGTTGLAISILTYDNRIQLGLLVDKALIPSAADAQSILDNAFKCIEELNKKLL